jgi:hypothetical protein
MACSSHFRPSYSISYVAIQKQNLDSSTIKLIAPYQDTLFNEFGAVIAKTNEDLIIKRPCSNLMNWCADAVLSSQTNNKRFAEPVICLLNTGGLRATFGSGDLTLADFYKLMPFDNRLVWVRYPVSKLKDIESYLVKSGGEPIANCSLENGQLRIPQLLPQHSFVWILTSDFLANGGDQMSFFLNEEKQETNMLLRDIFINVAQAQQILVLDPKPRIQ